MIPLPWLKVAPWLLAAVFAVLLCVMTGQYLQKRDELTKFRAEVAVAGQAAQEEYDKEVRDGEENLAKVKADHEKQIPTIRANAVARYLAKRVRNPDPGGGEVPANAASLKLDDGAGQECLPDRQLIEDAADDAAKVEAFRAYCALNNCPVSD